MEANLAQTSLPWYYCILENGALLYALLFKQKTSQYTMYRGLACNDTEQNHIQKDDYLQQWTMCMSHIIKKKTMIPIELNSISMTRSSNK